MVFERDIDYVAFLKKFPSDEHGVFHLFSVGQREVRHIGFAGQFDFRFDENAFLDRTV